MSTKNDDKKPFTITLPAKTLRMLNIVAKMEDRSIFATSSSRPWSPWTSRLVVERLLRSSLLRSRRKPDA
jgi:hypothetical protein